ncbi:MAG: aldo/keto reductase [Pseudomonadota bacterium]
MMPDAEPLAIARTDSFLDRSIGRLSYGCWRLPGTAQSDLARKIDAALAIGANVIDTAAVYGDGEAETMLGKLFTERPSLRDDVMLVTKGGIVRPIPYDSTKAHLLASCDASLKRMKCEQIDIFLIHRPDVLAGHGEVADALNTLLESGKVRAVGVSNYSVEQTRALQRFVDRPLAVTQPEISALYTGALFDGTLDNAQAEQLLPMAWSPLAGGVLTAGHETQADRVNDVTLALDRIAAENDAKRECVALAWLLAHPAGIIPILGTQTPDRISAAAGAFEIKMNRRDWYAILEASLGKRMP